MATSRRKPMPPRGTVVRWVDEAESVVGGDSVLVWRYGVVVDLWSGRRPAGNYARMLLVAPLQNPPVRKRPTLCRCRRPAWMNARDVDVTERRSDWWLRRWRDVWAVRGPGGRWHVPRRSDYDFPGTTPGPTRESDRKQPMADRPTHHRERV